MQRSFEDTTWWDPYVEDITDEDTYLRRKFRQDVTDKTTGLSQKEIPARLAQIVAAGKAVGEPWRITKAKCFAAQVLEESIDVSPLDWFPAIAVWDRNSRPITKVTKGDRTTKGERALEVNAPRRGRQERRRFVTALPVPPRRLEPLVACLRRPFRFDPRNRLRNPQPDFPLRRHRPRFPPPAAAVSILCKIRYLSQIDITLSLV